MFNRKRYLVFIPKLRKSKENADKEKRQRKQTKTTGSVSLTIIAPIARSIPSFIIQASNSFRELSSTSVHST